MCRTNATTPVACRFRNKNQAVSVGRLTHLRSQICVILIRSPPTYYRRAWVTPSFYAVKRRCRTSSCRKQERKLAWRLHMLTFDGGEIKSTYGRRRRLRDRGRASTIADAERDPPCRGECPSPETPTINGSGRKRPGRALHRFGSTNPATTRIITAADDGRSPLFSKIDAHGGVAHGARVDERRR